MPRYQVTASFEPYEIEAIDRSMQEHGFKSRYKLIRAAVLGYCGVENGERNEKDEKRIVARTDRQSEEPINDVDGET